MDRDPDRAHQLSASRTTLTQTTPKLQTARGGSRRAILQRPHPGPPPDELHRLDSRDKLTLAQVGTLCQTGAAVVRGCLIEAGIGIASRTTRATRRQLDIGLTRQLYTGRKWSAQQIAADQRATLTLVLRALHEQGIAVGPGGPPPSHRPTLCLDPRLVAL